MTIAWNAFTPWSALTGGVLIGIAVAMFVLLNGRIAGRRAARHERIFERSAPMRAETEAKANEIKQSLALLRRSL